MNKILHLSDKEIERRCVMVDLHYRIYRRSRARNFQEWLTAQILIDRAWETIMGHSPNGYTHLADQELIFPNVMRRFNGQDQN